MRPALIDSMSWAMAEVYGAVTDRILVNLARHFPYIKNADQIRGSFDYQARLLAQMGQVNRESADIIMQSLDGADEVLRGALETAILDALKGEEAKLKKAAQQGLLNGPGFLPPEVTPNQMQAFKSYYAQSADKLNLVNTVMLESTQAAYTATVTDVAARIGRTQSILNVGAGEVVTGVSSWNQAMHDAVKKMVTNGLTGFIDHGGHKWSPEAYVAMDIRTTMFNTARAAIAERAGQYGADLYQVSSHNGARPLCYPWQGKVISRSDWTGDVEDIDGNKVHVYAQSETSYGEAAGLFGVNCRHYPMTFIPGFSAQRGEPQDPEENAEAYALSQQQRGMERKLREEKRDLAVMKAQGASEDQIRAQRARVSQASSRIDEFCDEHDMPRRRNREFTPVNATWPQEGSYDPTTFPTDQRDKINDWFKNGGNDNNPPQNPIHLGPNNIPPKGQAQTSADNSLDDLFGDLWSGNADESDYLSPVSDNAKFHPSTKYGSFGIENKDYPKPLRLTEKEEQYIENVLKDFRGEKTPKDFEYQPIMGRALRPVKTLELNEAKRVEIQAERAGTVKKLEQAEAMIAQRKAEGYTGKSREQSYKDWQKLQKELKSAEDEVEHAQILAQASIGKEGIQYWYSQRKESNKLLDFIDFANKVVDREKFALEHGFNGANYD